jgi:hypothetical protein
VAVKVTGVPVGGAVVTVTESTWVTVSLPVALVAVRETV